MSTSWRNEPLPCSTGATGGTPDQPVMQQWLMEHLRALPESGGDRSGESMAGLVVEGEDPFLADLIWWKGEQYVVVVAGIDPVNRWSGASLRVNGEDVRRAARRAATLQLLGTGSHTLSDTTQAPSRRATAHQFIESLCATLLIRKSNSDHLHRNRLRCMFLTTDLYGFYNALLNETFLIQTLYIPHQPLRRIPLHRPPASIRPEAFP